MRLYTVFARLVCVERVRHIRAYRGQIRTGLQAVLRQTSIAGRHYVGFARKMSRRHRMLRSRVHYMLRRPILTMATAAGRSLAAKGEARDAVANLILAFGADIDLALEGITIIGQGQQASLAKGIGAEHGTHRASANCAIA